MNGNRNACIRTGVSTALLCVGVCLIVLSCVVGTLALPKRKIVDVTGIRRVVPNDDHKDDAQEPLYLAIIGGSIVLACVTIVGGLCGLCGGKDKSNAEMESVENGQLKPRGKNDKFRSSFRIPQEKTQGDEFVVDDACGNPLFVKIDEQGKPVVRDLGGNVLDVEVDENRMVAVYNAEPPSTDRTAPAPPAYTEKPLDDPAAAAPSATVSTTTDASAAPASEKPEV